MAILGFWEWLMLRAKREIETLDLPNSFINLIGELLLGLVRQYKGLYIALLIKFN